MKTLKLFFACFLVIGLLGMSAQAALIMVPGDYDTIQEAVDDADPEDTIYVHNYEGAGAEIDKPLTLIGSGNARIKIGVDIEEDITAGFYIPPGHAADGTRISNFTINCPGENNLLAPVFARGADDITVSHMTITDPVQGITNSGGKGWTITHNKISGLDQSAGEGFGIILYGYEYDPEAVIMDNLVAFNKIEAHAVSGFAYLGIILIDEGRPVNDNRIVHNVSVVEGEGPFVGGLGLIFWVGAYEEIKGNRIGFNDFRGSSCPEIVAYPTADILTVNLLSRNLGYYLGSYDCENPSTPNRAADGTSPTLFNPVK